MKLSIDNLKPLLECSFRAQLDPEKVRLNKPPILCINGNPGSGKTGVVKTVANMLAGDVALNEFIGSSYGTEDFGLGVPDHDTKMIEQYSTGVFQGKFPGAEGADLIVIFFDELDKYSGDIQAMLLSLIESRKFHGEDIDPRIVFVCAMNPVDGGGESDLIPPLQSRLTHITSEVDPEAWCEFAMQNDVHPAVIGFIHWQCCGNHSAASLKSLSNYDPDTSELNTASPRSWCKASTFIEDDLPRPLLREALAGTVGAIVTEQFLSFMDTYLTNPPPTLDEIIEDPQGAALPADHATMFAVISMLVSYVASKGKRARDKNAIKSFVVDAIVEYIERIPHEAHQLVAMQQCCKANPLFAENKSDILARC